MVSGGGWFRKFGTVATAALLCAAIGFSSASHAQNPNDPRLHKKAPPKGAVVAPRKGGPGAVPPGLRPNRAVTLPNGRTLAPNILGRAGINPAGPNIRPGSPAFGARGNAPGGRAANFGPGARFGSNRPGGFQPRGFTNRDPRLRAVNAATPQQRQFQRVTHRSELFAMRARMPVRPLPGERNFTGIPPVDETRFITTDMVCQWGPDMSQQRIEEIARQHNLEIVSVQRSVLTGGTRVHFRIGGNRAPRDVVRAMEAEQVVSQPNYVYEAVQQEPAAAQTREAADDQYAATKLKLAEAHKIATGKGVMVAVIDSEIDGQHPELAKGIAEKFDAVGQPDKPHTHGTGMAGAIVSQDRLMGVAPGVRALAIHAFATGSSQSPQATTQSIITGLEWALNKGVRIINMSFAGPYDPMLALAMKKASEKGAILIAAVGNAGPKSPPLYPAADPHVIGVTATDEDDKPYNGANIGVQVAVAAPGVDVMVPAPAGAYQLTTGTSVAAAHVSGVVALLLEKHPDADAQTILEVLTASATRLAKANKRDDQTGWGLIDPLAALSELDARLSDAQVAGATPAPPAVPTSTAAAPPQRAPAATPASATTRPALPRPGIYLPKQ